MSYRDEARRKAHSLQRSNLQQAALQRLHSVPKKSLDEARAEDLQQTKALVNDLLDGMEIDEFVKSMLTINTSTMLVKSSERPEPTLAERKQALWDYWKFLEIINFHGGPLAFGECHFETVAWSFREQASFRQLILEARGHLKSTLFSVGRNLWRIYQNPNIRCFVGTESLKLSKAFIKEIEGHLTEGFNQEFVWNKRPHFAGPLIPSMDSPGTQRRRGLTKDVSYEFGEAFDTSSQSTKKKVWRAEALQVLRPRELKEPTITAGSVGQVSVGFHFDDITFDDVHSFANTRKPELIDKVFSWIYDCESLLDPPYVDIELLFAFREACPDHIDKLRKWSISGGRQYVIGTRYAEEDYYGHIIENAKALHYETHVKNIYANGRDAKDGYRWPEKWNEQLEAATIAKFERKYGSTGLQRYYSQYHNIIRRFEDSVLDWSKVRFLQPQDFKLCEDGWVEAYGRDHKKIGEFKPQFFLDPAATASARSDFTAMCVGGKSDSHVFVCDFQMGKWPVEEYIDLMFKMLHKWRLKVANIELVSGFKTLKTAIKNASLLKPEEYGLIVVKEHNPSSADLAKKERIEITISPLLHNELLYLPHRCSQNRDLIKQFQYFGEESAKDDGLDVIQMLANLSKKFHRHDITGSNRGKVVSINQYYGGLDYENSNYGGVEYGT